MLFHDSGKRATCECNTNLTQPSTEHRSDGDDLRKLGWEYAGLQRQLKFLQEEEHRLWPGEAWTEDVEAQRARISDPMKDRMVEIRWIAARLRATDLLGLQAKATMLQDIIDDEADSIRAQLTLSLCRDLISFPLHQNLISFPDIANLDDRCANLVEPPLDQIETAPAG